MKQIKLTQNKVVMIDDKDFDFLNQSKWYAHKSRNTFYAVRKQNKKSLLMHRLILNTPKNLFTDHIDGNGLNNQISNLRICNNSKNQMNRGKQSNNTSGYKGIRKHRNKWQAIITFNKKDICLGTFLSKKDAVLTYNKAAQKYFGEFARLNEIKVVSDKR